MEERRARGADGGLTGGRILQEEKGAVDVPGAVAVPMEPGSEEQMAERHADASGEEENQLEENRMRDIHTGKRGAGDRKMRNHQTG